jgi:UDPglucose 6-dehydrogenase
MRICIIGAGYVGLTTGAVLAHFGHTTHCVDIDQTKINLLKDGKVPIYEPGLSEMINQNIQKGTLQFSTKIKEAIKASEIVMITVGTPALPNGNTNLSFIEKVVDTIATCLDSYKIIITKSTVPPGTNEWIHQKLLATGISKELFDIVSNPEFLKEGSALQDILHPDKTVIGVKREQPIVTIKKLYAGIEGQFIISSLTGAELIKYASNAFLATKISFMNEMARICDVYDVDIKDIERGIGTDPRIGPHFLKAGLGYGGSCFPKDIHALYHAAKKKNVEASMLEATMRVNQTQVDIYVEKLLSAIPDDKDIKITIWGITFKPNTNDIRSSQSIALINKLQKKYSNIHVYDPLVTYTENGLISHNNQYESIIDSDVLVIATDWDIFKKINWKKVKNRMRGNVILDARNIVDPVELEKNDFQYIGIGRIVK